MGAGAEQFYDGSRSLEFFANATSMAIDQVNFLFAQFSALFLAYILRTCLPPLSYGGGTHAPEKTQARSQQRHLFAVISGISITYFCFGKQLYIALSLGAISYTALVVFSPSLVHKVTLAACMGLLSITHIYRQILQDGVFVIDITGSLMLMVQRCTSLAFAYNDGMTKSQEKMTKLQKDSAVMSRPSMLEFFSYLFSFQSVLAGPFLMFKDYQDFISGTDEFARAVVLQKSVEQAKAQQQNHTNQEVVSPSVENNNLSSEGKDNSSETSDIKPPSLNTSQVAFRKLIMGLLFALSTVTIAPQYSVFFTTVPEFMEYSFLSKIFYIVLSTTIARHLYYAAWLMAEATCHMGGLGYSGTKPVTSKDGNEIIALKHTWDGASNVDILGVEFGSSLRTTLESWNQATVTWLKYTAHERLPGKLRVVGTHALSAIWHGFYPGYFCCFLIASLGTYGSRAARRFFRPKVVALQGSESGPIMSAYHVVTWVAKCLILSYGTFSFVLLAFQPVLSVYSGIYFYLHIILTLCMVVLPSFTPKPSKASLSTQQQSDKLKAQSNGAIASESVVSNKDKVC